MKDFRSARMQLEVFRIFFVARFTVNLLFDYQKFDPVGPSLVGREEKTRGMSENV